MSPTRKAQLARRPDATEPAQATEAEATARADRVREILVSGADQILPILAVGHARKDWRALGHASFADYVQAEYRGWLPRFESVGERTEIIRELVSGGMSQRDAGAVTGTSGATVNRAVNPPHVPDETSQPDLADQDAPDQQQDDEPDQGPSGDQAGTEPDQQPDPGIDLATLTVFPVVQALATELDWSEGADVNIRGAASRYSHPVNVELVRLREAGVENPKLWLMRQALTQLPGVTVHGDLLRLAEPMTLGGVMWHRPGQVPVLVESRAQHTGGGRKEEPDEDEQPPQASDTSTPQPAPEETETPAETPAKEARKQMRIARSVLRKVPDIQGLNAGDTAALKLLAIEVEDALTDVREFLAALCDESAEPGGLDRYMKYTQPGGQPDNDDDDDDDADDEDDEE